MIDDEGVQIFLLKKTDISLGGWMLRIKILTFRALSLQFSEDSFLGECVSFEID